MIISASLFSCQSGRTEYVHKLASFGIRLLHIDYIEGDTPYKELADLNQIKEDVFWDVHMICTKIRKEDIELLNSLHVKYLCYQYENLENKNFEKMRMFEGKKGISFTMETPITVIESLISKVDFILVMCTVPGVSGQKFNYDNIKRIRDLKRRYPEVEIHVDGGIEFEKSVIMSHLNVSLIVSGSFFANASENQLAERICQLKYAGQDVTAEEIMIPISVLSIVDVNDSLFDVLYAINQDKLAVVIVEENQQPVGIITDGDVRRVLLREREKSFLLCAKDIVNRSPITVQHYDTVSKLLYDRYLYNRAILVLPCVKDGNIIGLIDMKNM